MSEALYERYKDALRRGHAAALRGRFDEAIAAYAEAASIAPDRAMPQASLAGVLARTGRISEALAAYEVALSRAPEDEASLRGRAEMLAITGRRVDAAETLDRLSAVLDRDGRLLEATDAAASRPRVRRVTRPPRGRGRVRDPPAGGRRRPGVRGAQPGARHARRPSDGRRRPRRPAAGAGTASSSFVEQKRDPRRSVMSAAAVLTAAAETALDGGDQDEARRCYLEAAAAQRSIGNLHAAMDSMLPGPGRLAGGR